MRWQPGEVIVHREVWRGVPWCAFPVVVVEDSPELLVTYLPEESPFAFPPSADGRPHPWAGKRAWEGHGMLALRRPGEAYSVMHFWEGPNRRFAGLPQSRRAIPPHLDRVRLAGPRARLLAPRRRPVAEQGRRPARAAGSRGSLHSRAARRDLRARRV